MADSKADAVGVLGTGQVAQRLVGRLSELGYEVWVGARSADSESLAPFAEIEGVRTGSFADAAAASELLINATNGRNAVSALSMAGADNLAGKPVIDVSNDLEPVDGGFPRATATVDNSIGQRLQNEFPDALIVKSLNTMNNNVMVEPTLVPGDHVVFMSGDSALAKDRVAALLQSFGWRPEQIVDLGGIDSAVGPEMLMALWLRVAVARGWDAPPFNWAIHSAG
ncbi:MAG TPA: NAD(P)-binding domain-containing protein [Nocardioidaceae bacterium]|nr:NAD(P)-binding domain-containing protein [Nocardioidaceae bacterium]